MGAVMISSTMRCAVDGLMPESRIRRTSRSTCESRVKSIERSSTCSMVVIGGRVAPRRALTTMVL